MKKIFSFAAFTLLMSAIALSFSACGGDDDDDNKDYNENSYDLTKMTETEVMKAMVGSWYITCKGTSWGSTDEEDPNGVETGTVGIWEITFDGEMLSISGFDGEEFWTDIVRVASYVGGRKFIIGENRESIILDEAGYSDDDYGEITFLSPNKFILKAGEGSTKYKPDGWECIYTCTRIPEEHLK